MAFCVCTGAVLKCSFGLAPSALNVLPVSRVTATWPAAAMNDHVPILNILPFGMCQSLSNPMVAAATAAALGVLTPLPCIPVCAAPWSGTSTKVMIGGKPALTSDSKLTCVWGGQIQIVFPGQATVLCG